FCRSLAWLFGYAVIFSFHGQRSVGEYGLCFLQKRSKVFIPARIMADDEPLHTGLVGNGGCLLGGAVVACQGFIGFFLQKGSLMVKQIHFLYPIYQLRVIACIRAVGIRAALFG